MQKIRRRIIIFLFFILAFMLITGLFTKNEDPELGHKLIGLSLLAGISILMPLFIYHRWKDKDIKKYMLTKENIEVMQKFDPKKENN